MIEAGETWSRLMEDRTFPEAEIEACLVRLREVLRGMARREACLMLGGVAGVLLAGAGNGFFVDWVEYVRRRGTGGWRLRKLNSAGG
jgi:hypothetical protein